MMRTLIVPTALLLSTGLALQSAACASEKRPAVGAPKPAPAAGAALTQGEVRRVDKAAGTVTIQHGAMPKFDMPPMTMPYRIKDRALLEQLKPGDKIAFDADAAGGVFTVIRLEKLK